MAMMSNGNPHAQMRESGSGFTRADGDIIAVRGISKVYPQAGGRRESVLRDVNLTIAPGAILGLLGPNGAGKTTLIKILAGLLRPDNGGGTVLGYDLLRQHAAVRARVSLVAPTADVGIDNNLTVQQNLAFWAPIYGLRGAHARARIDEVLGALDLVEQADFWPMHISAGQRQRLALARSLLAENRLVFLDEPTNKLDLAGVRSVRRMIAELNRERGVTVVLTTHVMEEAEELCGEIALLRQGELVAHQPTADLTRSLQLTRPITVIARLAEASAGWREASTKSPETSAEWDQWDQWDHELAHLPGATGAVTTMAAGSAEGSASRQVMLTVDTLDLRATTPALLAWVRTRSLSLVSMRAEPVTLSDVFLTLAYRQRTHQRPSEMRSSDGVEKQG